MAKKADSNGVDFSAKVKLHHANLRKMKTSGRGADEVWQDHISDKTALKEYASAMHSLATGPWQEAGEDRIRWCISAIEAYFLHSQLTKLLHKDLKRVEHQMPTLLQADLLPRTSDEADEVAAGFTGRKLKLLDVGSCYNPFQAHPLFDVTAVDLCPAVESVYECDFLEVGLTDHLSSASPSELAPKPDKVIKHLPIGWFDVVIFSLLLSYFPSPTQRMRCCIKAHQVLTSHGALLVLTPDSSHQNRHTDMMKSWRTAIESLGFHRCTYAKLTHLHCMVFRKTSTAASVDYDAVWERCHGMLYIPQDSQELEGDINGGAGGDLDELATCSNGDVSAMFQQLPFNQDD